MMDEDGFGGSGLREEQLITPEEMETIIREVLTSSLYHKLAGCRCPLELHGFLQ